MLPSPTLRRRGPRPRRRDRRHRAARQRSPRHRASSDERARIACDPRQRRLVRSGLDRLAECSAIGPRHGNDRGALLAPIILHLVAAASGALRGSTIRALVAAAYVVTIALSLARAAVRDPIRDLDCFEPPRNCSENVFLLWANEDLARQLDLAQIGVAIAISLGLAVMAAWRLLGGTRPARRSHGPLLVFGAVVGVADTTYIVLLAADHLQTAAEPSLGAAFMVQAGAITALAITLGWQVARARSIGVSVARLATDIGAAPHRAALNVHSRWRSATPISPSRIGCPQPTPSSMPRGCQPRVRRAAGAGRNADHARRSENRRCPSRPRPGRPRRSEEDDRIGGTSGGRQ